MDRSLLMAMARPANKIKLGHRTFQVRASAFIGPLTPNEADNVLKAHDGSTVKVTQTESETGQQRYRYEVKNQSESALGIITGTQSGVGTDGFSGCVIKAAAEKAGWAGVIGGRPGKIDVEAGEGDVQVDFGYRSDIGSVVARIETQHGKVTVKDESPRRTTPFGVPYPYYQGSLAVAINRARGSVDVLIGNSEDGKTPVVTVAVDGQSYQTEINGDTLAVGVREDKLLILVDDVTVIEEPLTPSN